LAARTQPLPSTSTVKDAQPILDYSPPPEFDTGRFAARYLQVLALLSIGSMLARAVFRDQFNLDLSFILLLWAASALKRRSQTARGFVLLFGGIGLAFCLFATIMMILSPRSGQRISFFGGLIKDAPLWMALSINFTVAVVIAIPFGVLLSPRAHRQFGAFLRRREVGR
jgi:hypothetical protein